ncbi:MAG: hypothetical protein ACHQ5A_12910, partial [Opitutales bacterium]
MHLLIWTIFCDTIASDVVAPMPVYSTESPNPLIIPPAGFRGRMQEVAMFLDGTDRIHATMRRVAG